MKNSLTIPVLITIVYLLTNLIVPYAFRSEMIFLANVALWATVIVLTLLIAKHQQIRIWKIDRTSIQLAVAVTVFQLLLLIFVSFFMGFGKNANVWTPFNLAIYFPYLLSSFLAIELSRAYLTQTTSKRKPTLALLTISLFYTLTLTSIGGYTSLTTPLAISEFLIKTFIPTLATSLLATYFAYIGKLPANLTYMAIPTLFTWFSPILPNPPWAAQSMLTVTATTIGFAILDKTATPPTTRHFPRTLRKQKSQILSWTAIALIGLISVWSSTGLLGFTPTIIASGSMQPALNPGDIAIIIAAPPATIKTGDIIQYSTAEAPTIHRVIDISTRGGSLWFTTKGDANNAPDTEPVNERQLMGKAVLTIPQLGWASITLKEIAANTYTFFTTTAPQTLINALTWTTTNGVYATTALSFILYSYLLLSYRRKKKEEKT